MNRPLLALLLSLGAACASAPRPAPTAPVVPATARAFLWEVTRPEAPDRPLYLTGSVHVGRPGQFVLPPSMESAFARAQALVVELDPQAVEPHQMQEAVMRLGLLPPPDRLSAHLSEPTRQLLPPALERVGMPLAVAERIRPWMLSLTLAVLELRKAGYTDAAGIDRLLLDRARGQKAVVELETMEEQLEALAGMPDAVQERVLRDQLERSGQAETMLLQVADAWARGDPEALAAVVLEDVDDPALQPYFEALFFARNRRMADALVALLDRPQVHFAVVGAGHLVGEQGIPALLERRGLRVRQLPRTP